MAYVLRARDLPPNFQDDTVGRCIFCGESICHYNADKPQANGWIVNAFVDERARSYYYCNKACPQREADERYEHSIWRCGCIPGYIENVGDVCAHCGAGRESGIPTASENPEVVHVLEARLVFKDEQADRQISRFNDLLDSVVGPDVRIILDGSAVICSAEEFDLVEWVRDGNR